MQDEHRKRKKMSSQKRGVVTVISGFSGSGKGTVVKEIMAQYPDRFRLSVSVTTRPPRDKEREGVDYFFIDQEQYDQMVKENQLLEHAEYAGGCYGTPRAFVEENLAAGRDVILEIEQKGAFQVKEMLPDAVLIFLTAPSAESLVKRLRGRNETDEFIAKRMAKSVLEASNISRYDYLVVNETVEQSVRDVCGILDSERLHTDDSRHLRITYHEDFISGMQEQLEAYRKED